MGLDIYGIKPPVPMPLLSDDATPEQGHLAREVRENWKRNTPGAYYTSTWWNWRPIQALVEIFNTTYDIGIPEQEIDSLNSNNGKGIADPQHCNKLADAFEDYINAMERKKQQHVYWVSGLWVHPKTGRNSTEHITNLLNDKYKGLTYEPVHMYGEQYVPRHSTNVDQLKHFAVFLRNCNGFWIY